MEDGGDHGLLLLLAHLLEAKVRGGAILRARGEAAQRRRARGLGRAGAQSAAELVAGVHGRWLRL